MTPGWPASASPEPAGWGPAGLLAVAGQRPDQGRVAPGDGIHNQAVEAVVLGAPGPDRDDGGLEGFLHFGEHEVGAARVLDLEVVHPDRRLALARHREAGLGQRLQAHVVEHWQDIGQGRRFARTIELEAELQGAVGLGAVGAARTVCRPHGLDHGEVGQRLGAKRSR